MLNYVPLNFSLMTHPANWIVVTLMVLLGSFAVSLIVSTRPAVDVE